MDIASIVFIFPTKIFCRGVLGFATGCPCGIWGRGLTTYPWLKYFVLLFSIGVIITLSNIHFWHRTIAQPSGTFWYHSHHGSEFSMGLHGALVVIARGDTLNHVVTNRVSYSANTDRWFSCCQLCRHCHGGHSEWVASEITDVSIDCSSVCSGADQRIQQSSASLDFLMGIHRWPVDSPQKGPVTREMLPFDDVIMDHKVGININHRFRYSFTTAISSDSSILTSPCPVLLTRLVFTSHGIMQGIRITYQIN